jgi:restriction-modification system family protein
MAEEIAPRGKAGEPLEALLKAFRAAGWKVELRQPVSQKGGPNPTRIDLRRGGEVRRFLVYSWYLTNEGKGRTKDDLRIQTTRTHPGPLMVEDGRVTIGIGWDRRRDVFAAFDGWTKRHTGSSSSVHVKDELLERALEEGWAEGDLRWDPRATFTAASVDRLLAWVAAAQAEQREAPMKALEMDRLDHETAEIVGDVWRSGPAPWLREGDRLIATDGKKKLVDDSLWRVEELESLSVPTDSGRYNRTRIRFRCRRVGTVRDPGVLDLLS